MTDLDDLINDDLGFVDPEEDPTTGQTFPVEYEEEDEAPNFITAMVVHNQHLYISTIAGGLYRNFLRQKGNKWESVDWPTDG